MFFFLDFETSRPVSKCFCRMPSRTSILSIISLKLSGVVRHRLLVHRFGQSCHIIVDFRLFVAKTSNFLAKSQRLVVHFFASVHPIPSGSFRWCSSLLLIAKKSAEKQITLFWRVVHVNTSCFSRLVHTAHRPQNYKCLSRVRIKGYIQLPSWLPKG